MNLTIRAARPADAAAIAALRTAVADDLTARHGRGHWSYHSTDRGVLRAISESIVVAAAFADHAAVATFRLSRRKPWAIDVRFFTPVKLPLYLLDMAVQPERQGQGIGRLLLTTALAEATAHGAHAIRLDAYDTAAGAGDFYARCGYRHVGDNVYRSTPLRYYELLL